MWNHITTPHLQPIPYLGGLSPSYVYYQPRGGNGLLPSPTCRVMNPASSSLHQQIPPSVLPTIQLPNPILTPIAQDPYGRSYKKLPYADLFKTLLQNKRVAIHLRSELSRFKSLPLNKQLHHFITSQHMTKEDIRIRWQLTFDILALLRSYHPQCQVYVFGSLLTGLGDSSSDIDIYADLNGNGGQHFPKQHNKKLKSIRAVRDNVKNILETSPALHNRHRDHLPFTLDIRPLGKRVPYLRFIHHRSNLSCDLSVGSRLPVQNSKLLKFYINYDPRVGPLMTFLRYWGKFHEISGEMDIKQYGLSLLAIVYLTQKKIIPSIQLLQLLEAEKRKTNKVFKNPNEIDSWDASFSEDLDLINARFPERFICSPEEYSKDCGRILVEMALGFFGMVAKWDLSSKVICPVSGGVVPRDEFMLKAEIDNTDEFKDSEPFEVDRPFCLQDPFVLNFNVGRVVKLEVVEKFQNACRHTFQRLWPVKEKINSLLDLFEELPKIVQDSGDWPALA